MEKVERSPARLQPSMDMKYEQQKGKYCEINLTQILMTLAIDSLLQLGLADPNTSSPRSRLLKFN